MLLTTILLFSLNIFAGEKTAIRFKMDGANLLLRMKNNAGELVPTGKSLQGAFIELDIPTELVPKDVTQINFNTLIKEWKKNYPADFQLQSGVNFQQLRVVRNNSDTPEDLNLFAGLEFHAKRAGSTITPLKPNQKINMDLSCNWIEDQMPNHQPIHSILATEGDFTCTLCDKFTKSTTVEGVVSSVRAVQDHLVVSKACIERSMSDGINIVAKGFQRCTGKDENTKAIKPTCVTPELISYNRNILLTASACFGINPKNMFPMINHESRFFSNFQAAGGDTGFTQLTGPFVAEMVRKYGDDLNSIETLAENNSSSCRKISQEYKENLPRITNYKNLRCSWMNPVVNLALATAHFRDVVNGQREILNSTVGSTISEAAKEKILSMVATHSHHMPLSKARLRHFLKSPGFNIQLRRARNEGKEINFDEFVASYKRGFTSKAGEYLSKVLRDYNLLSRKQQDCGW